MNTPPNKEAQERYYLSEDGLTIYDREVFCHGDGPIFEDDSLCVFENKGRAKKVLELLNSHSTESAERKRLIEELETFCEQSLPAWVSPDDKEGFVGGVRYAAMIVSDHLRGNENE